MALPTMRAGITGREFLRIAGGFGSPALGTSPAGGLDVDNAGNLATDGDVTAKSLTVEDDVQQWKVETRVGDSDKFIIRDATNAQDVVEILPNAGDERMQMTTGETVFNQAALAVDHRFEGDTEANLLFVDSSASGVGIGTNAPATRLHVEEATTGPVDILIKNSEGAARLRTDGSALLLFAGSGGTEVMRLSTTIVTINETGADQDFKVEGDTTVNLFYVDAGNDRIGMGTNVPATDVLLDLVSTTKAFRPPSMSTTQRDALTASAGMMIYNATTNTMQFHNGTSWATI